MKIGIELLADGLGKSGCITFHRNLIYWLSKLAEDEIYFVFCYSKEYGDYLKYNQNVDKLKLINIGERKSLLKRIVDQQFKIPNLFHAYGIDIVYSNNTLPFWRDSFRYFYEVLITQQFHPEYPDKYFRRLFRSITTKYSCRIADKIIANSEYTKSEIIKYCKTTPDKIVVIHEASDTEKFFPRNDKGNLKKYISQKYGIVNNFILQVSGLYDHKNPIVSIKTLAQLRERGQNVDLVLAGIDPLSNWSRYKKIARKLNIQDNVHYVGFLMPEELNKFYNSSICLLYPSTSETFGIPPLEAMACETLVFGSSKSAVPEVIQDGGIIIDVGSPNMIAEKIIEILSSDSRAEAIRRLGTLRVGNFNWEKTITTIRQELLVG